MKHTTQLILKLKIYKNVLMNDYLRHLIYSVIVRSLLNVDFRLKKFMISMASYQYFNKNKNNVII